MARLSQWHVAFWKVLSYQRLVLTWDNVQVMCESQAVLCPESKRGLQKDITGACRKHRSLGRAAIRLHWGLPLCQACDEGGGVGILLQGPVRLGREGIRTQWPGRC